MAKNRHAALQGLGKNPHCQELRPVGEKDAINFKQLAVSPLLVVPTHQSEQVLNLLQVGLASLLLIQIFRVLL